MAASSNLLTFPESRGSKPMAPQKIATSQRPARDLEAAQDQPTLNEEECWRAVCERDGGQDGHFYFGVLTTGIFCRPSCPARQPLRRNTRFFRTISEAQAAGLRACKRCCPLERQRDDRVGKITALCAFIREHADSGEKLTLDLLAEQAGLSKPQLRRQFKEIVGMTPRQYIESCRFENLKNGLKRGEEVTRAIYDAGFASPSRVYEQGKERLGMKPSTYRAGGKGAAISYAMADSALGLLFVAATDHGLCFIAFDDEPGKLLEELRDEFPHAEISPAAEASRPLFEQWLEALNRHLDGKEPHLDLPLDVRATAFQSQVWRYLLTIPYGETRTYTDIAKALGRPKAARAVGTACGSNPVSIAIPCHRVLRSSGALAGYRWGLERKETLIANERRHSGA